jgi:hypothetical protein
MTASAVSTEKAVGQGRHLEAASIRRHDMARITYDDQTAAAFKAVRESEVTSNRLAPALEPVSRYKPVQPDCGRD